MVAELTRQGTRHVVGVEGLLPRLLYRYELDLRRMLDLTDPDTRTHIGITQDELVADDWPMCQQLGTEARALGDQGIRTHSGTGVDTVLVVPNPTDGRIGKRLYGRVGTREFHVILVVNPGDTLRTFTTVYEVDRKDFPDGRTRRRKR